MPFRSANPASTQERRVRRTQISAYQFDAPAPLRFWHLTSLDAPTVAAVWSLSFARAVGVDLPRWVPFLLALGTWCVYVCDRLLDAHTALGAGNLTGLRERHFFHWRHRRVLVPLACCAAAFAAAIVFSLMPVAIRERNSVLAFAALAYFSGVHLPRIPPRSSASPRFKEPIVGVLFTAGCAFPVMMRMHIAANFGVSLCPFLLLVVYFAALAWLNCSAIDRWESIDGAGLSRAAFTLAALGLLAALGFFIRYPHIAALFVAGSSSAAFLGALDAGRRRFTSLALRCAADLVLLTPMFCLLR